MQLALPTGSTGVVLNQNFTTVQIVDEDRECPCRFEVLCVHLPLCVFPSSPGVSIRWENTAYTISEDSGTVQFILLKEGSTDSNVSVEVMTVASSATGEQIIPTVY